MYDEIHKLITVVAEGVGLVAAIYVAYIILKISIILLEYAVEKLKTEIEDLKKGPSQAILSQPDWYIDSKSGDDNEDGKTRLTALKSFKELSRRWGKGNLLSTRKGHSDAKIITVHILDDLESTDPLFFDVILDINVALWFVGEGVSSSKPFTISSLIPRDRATNTPMQFTTDKALPVGDRIYNETGGTFMWVVKDQGSKVFRISEPLIMPATDFHDPKIEREKPRDTDDYKIQILREVKTGSMRVGSIHNGPYDAAKTFSKLVFRDLNITSDINPELDMGIRLFCYNCKIGGSIHLATGFDRNFINCCQNSGYTIRLVSGLTRFFGGAYISAAVPDPPGSQGFLPTNSTIQFDFDVIFQEHSISIVAGNTLVIGTAGVFDSVAGGNGYTNKAGHGIMVSAGSVTCRSLLSQEQFLWGKEQTGSGVGVSSGGRFYFVSNPPTITGKAGTPNEDLNKNFILGGSPTFYEPKNDGTFEPAKDNKWTNLIIPQPAGTPPKFRNACNPISDSWILKTE